MTFRPELAGGCEAAKIAALIVPYIQGRSLDIGSGQGKAWPSMIGIDINPNKGRPITDMTMDGTDLSLFGDATFDAVFSSFLLHQIERSKVRDTLAEWARVLRIGGHMVLYVPDADLMPREADEKQKWDVRPGDVEGLLQETPFSWELIESERRDQGDEYGLLIVVRKVDDKTTTIRWQENLRQRNPDGKKRCLLVRYGAIGDAFVAASTFPGIRAQGYHLTVNCTSKTHEVLREDPNVDEWLIQADDFVPNEVLGAYWRALDERYDRVINLCESIEGLLLAMPGRLNHAYLPEARRAICGNINYLEHTHNIAGVSHEFGAGFYATEMEKKWAQAVRRKMDGHVVVWAVNGSSPHKVYPWTHIVSRWLLERTPAHVMFYGDPGIGKQLQDGIVSCLKEDGADMSRVHVAAGKWAIRQSLVFAQVADCIVGPETGPLNAMAFEAMPKVIYLSHSSAANLTKHWRNTTTLAPDAERAPCWPCHRLHHDWEYCFRDKKTAAALCASSIAPGMVFEAVALALGARKAA